MEATDRGRIEATSMITAELLRSTTMFEGLELQDLEELAAELTSRKLQAGDLVFNQGDSGDTMYFVASGQVNIFLPTNNLRPVSLADVEVGQYFGEMALFDDKPRSAGARAVRDTLVYELGRGVLTKYLERRPRAAMAILRTMNERLRQTNAMLSERVAKNVIEEFERGLSWADRLADKVAELNGSWKFILCLIAVVGLWFVTNVPGLLTHKPLDAYPYQFFNLVLAVLVALQGPLIVMSQNRQAEKDRKEAENDFKVNLKNEVNIETIIKDLKDFRLETLARLDGMNDLDKGSNAPGAANPNRAP
jgi:CRP/FNR family transcriptional regulator, cyclic AMP receptor protein